MLTALLLLASVAVPPVSAGGVVRILTPPKVTGTSSVNLHVVGFSTSPEVDVTVTGQRHQRVAVVDSFFHAHVRFGFGLHEIVVSVPGSSGLAETLSVLSSPRRQSRYEVLFPTYGFHREAEAGACRKCHSAAGAGVTPGSTPADLSAWCTKCHLEIRDLLVGHSPKRDPACTDCHRVQPDLTVALAGDATDRNPCYRCHTDKIGEFAQAFIHGPVAGGTCTVCHSPHGSKFEKNLLSDPGVLCASCHSMEQHGRRAVQHEPFEKGRCASCHDPHATNNRWVLVMKSEELCLKCHGGGEAGDMSRHEHPYNVKPRGPLEKNIELTSRGRLECNSCHDPHSSESEHLLRTSLTNTCVGCHPEHR